MKFSYAFEVQMLYLSTLWSVSSVQMNNYI